MAPKANEEVLEFVVVQVLFFLLIINQIFSDNGVPAFPSIQRNDFLRYIAIALN